MAMFQAFLLLFISVGVVTACQSTNEQMKKIPVTISNLKTVPSKFAVFNSKEVGTTGTGITEEASSDYYVKANIQNFAAKAVEEAAASLGLKNLKSMARQFSPAYEPMKCAAVLFGVTPAAEPTTGTSYCIVENNEIIGMCAAKADCADKAKLKPIDSKYLTMKIDYAPEADGATLYQLTQKKAEFESKLKEAAAKAYPAFSTAAFSFS